MIANATAHRRANAFAQALDARTPASDAVDGKALGEGAPDEGRRGAAAPSRGALGAERHTDTAQEQMVSLAEALGRLPSPALDPAVKSVQRAQLVAAMEAAYSSGSGVVDSAEARVPEQRRSRRQSGARPGPADRRVRAFGPRSRWGRRLAVSGLAVGVAAGSFSGAAVASSDALPGDTLYGLKRSMEDLRLTMADSDADRGEVYLDLASTRLNEARRLLERAKSGPLDDEQVKDVRRALAGMRDEAAQAHRLLTSAYRRNGSLQPMEALASFSDTQRRQWVRLSDRLPEHLSQERDLVSSVLDAIEDEVVPLRPLLPEPKRSTRQSTGREGTPESSEKSERSDHSGVDPSAATSTEGRADGGSAASASPKSPGARTDGLLGENGLLGGNGLLRPSPSQSAPPSGADGGGAGIPHQEMTLPPLLPGLLPGFDLGEDD